VSLPIDQQQFVKQVEKRLLHIFNAYAQGQDVPPAFVFKTEGFMEVGCSMGLVTEQQMQGLMQTLHREIFHTELPLSAGDGLQIPSAMHRAPVYPST
jgi:hypothetical protein